MGELVVDAERAIPAICLKCGKRKHIVRRSERLAAAGSAPGYGAIGGACGVAAARAMHDDPTIAALVLGGSLAGAVVVGLALQANTPKASLALPLCRDCNERWARGVSGRYWLLTALGVGAVAFAWSWLTRDSAGYVFGGVVWAVMILAALVLRLRQRFVWATAIRGSRVVLAGVSDDARIAIEARMMR